MGLVLKPQEGTYSQGGSASLALNRPAVRPCNFFFFSCAHVRIKLLVAFCKKNGNLRGASKHERNIWR